MKKTLRRIGIILLIPVLILLLLILLIYTPPIQNLLREKAVQYASEAAGFGISIDRIRLSFPLKLVAEGIEAVSENDTLITARRLDLHVKLLPLFRKQVDINGIKLEEARINTAQLIDGMVLSGTVGEIYLTSHGVDLTKETVLVNNADLKNANLHLLLNDTVTEKDTASAPLNWLITVEDLSLENVAFSLEMPADTLDLLAYINKADLRNGEVDLNQQKYRAENLKIEKSQFNYNSGIAAIRSQGFDPSHIGIVDINMSLDSVYYQGGRVMGTSVEELTLIERSGLQITSARGGVSLNDTLINVSEITIETPHSTIELSGKADWTLLETQQRGDVTARLNANIGKKDVVLFAGKLSAPFESSYPFRPLMIRANIDGSLQRLSVNELRAELPGAFRLFATGEAFNITDSLSRTAQLNIAATTGNIDFILDLLPSAQKRRFAIPQGMELGGTAELEGSSVHADLALQEGGGRLLLNGTYNSRIESYQAVVDINNIQVNHFLPQDLIYGVTGRVNIRGKGTDIFSTATQIDASADIQQLNYARYNLSNTQLTANLQQGIANITLESHNPQIDLRADLNGMINRNGIDMAVNMVVSKVDMYALQTIDKRLEFAFNLDAQVATDLKETHALSGRIGNMQIRTDRQNYYPKDIEMSLATAPDTVYATVDAGDLHLVLRGDEGIENLINESTAFSSELTAQLNENRIDHNELRTFLPDVTLQLIAGKQNPLNDYLETKGYDFNELSIDLQTSSIEGINGDAHVYAFHRDTIQLDTVRLHIYQDTAAIKLAANIANRPQNKYVFSASIDAAVRENTAQAVLKFYNAEERLGIELGAEAILEPTGITIHLIPEQPTLVFRPFNLNPDNYIFISNDNHIRANVSLLDDSGQGIRVYSLPSDTTVLQDMAIELRNIDLAEIRRVVPYMPDVSGILSAEAHYVKTEQHLQVAADIHVDSLVYEGNGLEPFTLSAVYLPGDSADHHLDAQLTYDNSEVMKLNGIYYASGEGGLDANAVFEHFPVNIANPFIPDGVAQLSGDIDGQLSIVGQLNEPHVNGEISLDSVNVLLPQYSAVFHLENTPMRVEESLLTFDNFDIYATQANNPFVVNGTVNFADLSNILTDLTLNATDYELLNASRTTESLLYGKVVLDISSTIKGPVDALIVRGDVTIQGTTNVTYVITDSPLVAQDRLGDMVTFVDFRDTTNYIREEVPTVELGGMDMLVTIRIDQAAKINADLTPDRSSYVELEGGGDLSLLYTELDGLALNGRYTLSSGRLKYTLIPFLAREFTINEGSYVNWSGDPMNPSLDLTAVNEVRASVREDSNSRMVTFDATLTLENTLDDLEISFGLTAPEDATIQNELAGMSEEELGKQAVAIMITGNYMGPSGNSNVGNNALNALLQQAIQGVAGSALKSIDITIDVESVNDYSFTFSKRFWNDRINVVIGGKISTGEEPEESGRQTFIDNVSLEYRLDRTGTRYVRVFHDVNYDSVLDGEVIETGGGIVLRKKMARLKELFTFRRKKKEVKVENNENISSIY